MNDYYETEADEGHGPRPSREYAEDRPARGPRRERPPGVPRGLDGLEKALAVLGEQVDRARDALLPILAPERPSPALASTGQDRDVLSPIGERLDNLGADAYRLGEALRYLLDRVDL